MKMRLVYALTCFVLLSLLVVANNKIDNLEKQVQLWQDAHTSLAQHWQEQEVNWSGERDQWDKAVQSRDKIIAWWENKPPEVVEKVVEVPVRVEVVREVEKIVYVPFDAELIPFNSKSDVKDYILNDFQLKYRDNGEVMDCDDYMISLAEQAMKERRPIGIMAEMIIREGKVSWFHFDNFAIVGNQVYGCDAMYGTVGALAGYLDCRLD